MTKDSDKSLNHGNSNLEPKQEIDLNAPELLMNYLRSQFEAAYQKERSDDRTGNTAPSGSFYQRKILLESDESSTIQATTRIVMRPPFSTSHQTNQDEFAEIYAIILRNGNDDEAIDKGSLFANVFLVHVHNADGFKPFVLVDENGCCPVDISELDTEVVLGLKDKPVTLEEEINDMFAPIKSANELLAQLETYNIVATND